MYIIWRAQFVFALLPENSYFTSVFIFFLAFRIIIILDITNCTWRRHSLILFLYIYIYEYNTYISKEF